MWSHFGEAADDAQREVLDWTRRMEARSRKATDTDTGRGHRRDGNHDRPSAGGGPVQGEKAEVSQGGNRGDSYEDEPTSLFQFDWMLEVTRAYALSPAALQSWNKLCTISHVEVRNSLYLPTVASRYAS